MEKIKKVMLIVLGNLCIAFSVEAFILPYNILTGGVAGIAVLLEPFITISSESIINLLTIGLFIVGAIIFGKTFALKTLLSTIVYPLWISFFHSLNIAIDIDPILASLYGGLLIGVGCGIVFRDGGSTGGMDIPPLIITKYLKIELSKSVFIIDFITVVCGLLIYGPSEVLLGLVSVYCASKGVDLILTFGSKSVKQIQVISDKYDLIKRDIIEEMDRSATIIKAVGAYTGEEKPVLLTIVDDKQYQDVLDIINKYDQSAFVITSDVKEVRGEGFSYKPRI